MSNRKQKSRSRRPVAGALGFKSMTSQFEGDGLFDSSGMLQIVGDPTSGDPTMREATLEDCVDDCPMCQLMREQILAGNPPQIMAFE